MNKTIYKVKGFLKHQSPTILTCVGAAGVVVTSVMTAKATIKATKLLEKAETEKGENLTKKEKFKVAAPAYIPTVIVGVSTIACIFGSNALNKRKQAALLSAYKVLDQSYKEYREKVEEVYGEGADKVIRKEIAKDKYEQQKPKDTGKELFYDDFSRRYFESTKEDILAAEYEINKRLAYHGGACLNEYYQLVGLGPVTDGKETGWNTGQMMDMYWDAWLEFYHEDVELRDGRKCTNLYFTEPVLDFENYC